MKPTRRTTGHAASIVGQWGVDIPEFCCQCFLIFDSISKTLIGSSLTLATLQVVLSSVSWVTMPARVSRPLATGVVDALLDACAWPLQFLAADVIAARREAVEMRMLTFEMSTAFSGVCAPSVSAEMMCAPLSNYQEEAIRKEYCSAVELLPQSPMELRMPPTPPKCLYGDIMSFCTPQTMAILAQHKLQNGDSISIEALEAIFIRRDAVSMSAPCICHSLTRELEVHCELISGWCHVAGIPCADWSSQGRKRGLCGKTMVPLFVWISLRRLALTPVLILENVASFPYSLLRRYLPMYDFQEVIICNEGTFGHAVSRTRKYCVGFLVARCRLERPLFTLPDTLRRTRGKHTWQDYLQAGEAELLSELKWARQRESTRHHDTSCLR